MPVPKLLARAVEIHSFEHEEECLYVPGNIEIHGKPHEEHLEELRILSVFGNYGINPETSHQHTGEPCDTWS